MKAAILSIGNEVVEGHIINGNAAYFASQLVQRGISVTKHLTIIDSEDEIIKAINYLKEDYDLIITSGGLGPTFDDKTKESLAKALGLTLEIDDHELQKLKDYFAARQVAYSDVNDKQALYSKIDNILINHNGSANGYYFTKDETTYCVLPGPPIENRPLLTNFLDTIESEKFIEKNMFVINIGESSSEALMQHIYAKYPDVYIGCYIQEYGLNYRLTSRNEQQVNECLNELKNVLKEYYLCDCEYPLEQFGAYLIENKISISLAESCTAGLASALIGSIPDISQVFKQSIVTYSNEAKHQYLDVSLATLENYGAVSQECADEMVIGLEKMSKAEINISITGLAGPNGGSEEKPVGLVYFAIKYLDKIYQYKMIFTGDRNLIRARAARFILYSAYKLLKDDANK